MGILYSQLKVFHYPAKVASLPASNPTVLPPLHVRIKPTNVCCHRCTYCCYRQPDFQLGETMDERDSIPYPRMAEIVDDLIAMDVKAVTFSGGGEPLCYPHLLQTAQKLAGAGIKFASLTNGARLVGDVAEFFAHHATWVRVSIDGWNAQSYAAYRGVSEHEFDRVLANMAAFIGYGGPCALSVVMNVDATNAPYVFSLIKTLAEVGVRSIKIAPIVKSNDGAENYRYHKPLVRTVRRQVSLAVADFPNVEISNGYKADFESYAKAYRWCPALQIRPVIGADLNVYSCQDKAYQEKGLLFSLKEQRFFDGWMRGDWKTKIDPSRDCAHHCQMNGVNKLLHEYFDVDERHEAFV